MMVGMGARGTATPGNPPGRPREADRAARRDALLETALRIFLAHGYAGTSIEQVAAEARVAKRTIYTSVGDKTDLFVAVVRRLGDRVVQPDADQPGDLRAFCQRLVRLMLSDEAVGLHRLVIAEAATFPELADRLYLNGPQRYIDALRTLLNDLPIDELRVNPHRLDDAAQALFTLLLGERQRRRLFLLASAPSEADVRSHVDTVLALFVSQPSAPRAQR